MNKINKPKIKYPKWLPTKVGNIVQKYIDNDYHIDKCHNFERIKTVFTENEDGYSMDQEWKELYDLSPEVTEKFATFLLFLENQYIGEKAEYIETIHYSKAEKQFSRVENKARQLMQEMKIFNRSFADSVHGNSYSDLINSIGSFIKNSRKLIDENTHDIDDSFVVNRKNKDYEDSIKYYFEKKISSFFKENYYKAHEDLVSAFMDQIFPDRILEE